MNKIYNNLTIDNLMRTEWFNQFDEYQQYQILEGLEANLNVNLYAKTEYNEHQMSQIRKGLKNNLDISSICKNFDETHKSCYYDLFRMPPINIFFK